MGQQNPQQPEKQAPRQGEEADPRRQAEPGTERDPQRQPGQDREFPNNPRRQPQDEEQNR